MNDPVIHNAYIAPTATVVGDVILEKDVNIWYGAVLRGDAGTIRVGEGTNIQDVAVLHEEVTVGKGCTIGHGAIVHGCTIGDNCVIGANTVVKGEIPANSIVYQERCNIIKIREK